MDKLSSDKKPQKVINRLHGNAVMRVTQRRCTMRQLVSRQTVRHEKPGTMDEVGLFPCFLSLLQGQMLQEERLERIPLQ